jgi:carbamoyltransferase
MFYGKGANLKFIKSQKIPHSLGMLYAAISDYLGFKPWDEEGKVMALAAYGNPIIPVHEIVTIGDGWFKINKPFLMVETKHHDRCYDKKLLKVLGPARKKDESIMQFHKDVASSLQRAVEEVCKSLVLYMHKVTGSRNLCVSGGVALNCKMNGELLKLPFVDDIYVPSAPGDNGSSLGAALYSSVIHCGAIPESLHVGGIGQEFTDAQIKNELEKSDLIFYKTTNIAKKAADILLKGEIIAWYQGKTEFGPRALGHRSLLALAGKEEIRDFININVKNRELWRPLCPSILPKQVSKYFRKYSNGRFMNVAFEATDYAKERIPAVIHIDNTIRAQLVYSEESEVFYNLLELIGQSTGDPVLLNTSFNRCGEPIVNSPFDAINSFQNMQINYMIIENYVVRKKNL